MSTDPAPKADEPPDESSDEPSAEPVVTIANEFTTARVRKVLTRNGERLEIHSAKLGTTILLDPLELESLTWQTTETFSRMLEDPYGPEHVAARPLSDLVVDRGREPTSDEPTEPDQQ